MSKIAVELKINVSKIDKSRLFKGKKGTYLDLTTFIDLDNVDDYGQNGMITHKRLEGENQAPILGNCKIFWRGDAGEPSNNNPQMSAQEASYNQSSQDSFDDDIPF